MISVPAAMLIAGLSGFIALSYEILWYRIFALATGGTAPIFAFVLGAYLYGLAAGSYIARLIARRAVLEGRESLRLQVAGFILGANVTSYLVLPAGALSCGAGECFLALPGVTLAASLLGAVLPLVCHAAIPADRLVGVQLSRVYSANIVGAVVGSLVTGYVLMEYLPTRVIAVLLLGIGLLIGTLPLGSRLLRPQVATIWLGMVTVAALLVVGFTAPVLRSLHERLIFRENYRAGLRFAHTLENRAGVVNITNAGRVFGGGVYDGYARVDLMEDPNLLVRVAAVPAFHKPPRNVLMIGLSMGAWAQVVANLPTVEHVTIVEINPGYLSLIPHYPDVASLLENPKVSIVVDDGRRWLVRHPRERFDLIVANVTFHWREHATNLLSKEFLELIRVHLEPGGAYFYNATSSADVFKTGLTVFPHGLRVLGFLAVSDQPLAFNPEVFAATVASTKVNGRPLLDPGVPAEKRRLDELVAFLTRPATAQTQAVFEDGTELLRRVRDAKVVTDDNMAVEWSVLSGYTEQP